MSEGNAELRREPRFRVSPEHQIQVSVETNRRDTEHTVTAEVIDISQNGAKFRVNDTLEVKSSLQIDLSVEAVECQVQVSGDVCWVTPAGNDSWFVGCAFRPAIPEEVLARLAGAGFTDRRDSDRDAISLDTHARWELSQSSSDACIVNLSRGGFCLVCDDPGEPGRHVLLEFQATNPEPIRVKARSRWHVAHQGDYLVGCEFLDRHGYNLMRELHSSDMMGSSRSATPWRRLLGR